jgi:hypothetical protein
MACTSDGAMLLEGWDDAGLLVGGVDASAPAGWFGATLLAGWVVDAGEVAASWCDAHPATRTPLAVAARATRFKRTLTDRHCRDQP